MAAETDQIENPEDLGNDPEAIAKRWSIEIKLAQKEMERWEGRCADIIKRVRDDRSGLESQNLKRFNMLWSWFRTMQPAIYAQTPKVQAKRRFLDRDPRGKLGAEIVERATSISSEDSDFDTAVRAARDDFLLCGRGVAWLRYVPPSSADQVAEEKTATDYIHWKNFLHNPARNWSEVRWVSKEVFLTREECVASFGKEVGGKVQLDYRPKGVSEKELGNMHEAFKKARVFEIWDKASRKVYWISLSYKEGPLKIQDDPLRLRDFFPCPRPLYDTITTDTLVPVPAYTEWQDLAAQLDEVMHRRLLLTEALAVSGIYDANCEGIQRLLSEGRENKLIPIQNWPLFMNGGGVRGAIQFMPLQEIAETLRRLDEEAELIKKEIYEITGWSDIMRGATNPYETAKAQTIKGQFATVRLNEMQKEIQRFCRDVERIRAEIIVEHFSPETLMQMTGAGPLEEAGQQYFVETLQFLKNDKLRTYSIDIETDSTVMADEQAERQDRVQFLQVLTPFLEQMIQVASAAPQLLPACAEAIMFSIRTFKQGRSLETSFEQGTQAMVQFVQQQQQQQQEQGPPPDPEMAKAQAKIQADQAAAAIRQQTAQQDAQLKQQRMQADVMIQGSKAQAAMELEDAKAAHEMQLQRDRLAGEMALKDRSLILQAQQPRPHTGP